MARGVSHSPWSHASVSRIAYSFGTSHIRVAKRQRRQALCVTCCTWFFGRCCSQAPLTARRLAVGGGAALLTPSASATEVSPPSPGVAPRRTRSSSGTICAASHRPAKPSRSKLWK